ncbi:Adgb, partial [Lemmus lemmus]
LVIILAFTGVHFHISLAHVEKHEELISVGSPDSHAVSEGQKSVGASRTTRKGKEKAGEKEKLTKEKQAPRFEPQPIPTVHSQQEDPNKPYWVLKLVSEHSDSDYVDVKKDTDRSDEIRAMKQAWEATEPGRAIKASQARLKYLNKFIKKPPDVPIQETLSASQSQIKPTDEGTYTLCYRRSSRRCCERCRSQRSATTYNGKCAVEEVATVQRHQGPGKIYKQ